MSWDYAKSTALIGAIDALDTPLVQSLCVELIEHIRAGAPQTLDAHTILRALRGKRHFQLMRVVAEAFLQAGSTDATIRRQYAQALLEQGILTAAVAVLEELKKSVRPGTFESDEVHGLIGRAYKQMYLATSPATGRQLLERAIESYEQVYRRQQSVWHGINVVALQIRAKRDDIELAGDPEQLAREILIAIDDRGDAADKWERGTALEACVALNRPEEAMRRLVAYLESGADAFEIASTLRQLTEIWQLDAASPPGGDLIELLKSTLLGRGHGTGAVEVSPAEIDNAKLERTEPDNHTEKVLGRERFETLKWFRTALERCSAVALVEDPIEGGIGTGFLVRGKELSPGYPDVVMITNAHVVSADDPKAVRPDRARVTFRALDDITQYRIKRVLWTSPATELDATIVELDGHPDDISYCPVAVARPLLDSDPPPCTYVIGHPGGAEKVMLSVRDNRLLDADAVRLHYRTPTLEGSSGSPVFNKQWELIALHHSGDERMPRLNGAHGTYPANEGIWFDKIVSALIKVI